MSLSFDDPPKDPEWNIRDRNGFRPISWDDPSHIPLTEISLPPSQELAQTRLPSDILYSSHVLAEPHRRWPRPGVESRILKKLLHQFKCYVAEIASHLDPTLPEQELLVPRAIIIPRTRHTSGSVLADGFQPIWAVADHNGVSRYMLACEMRNSNGSPVVFFESYAFSPEDPAFPAGDEAPPSYRRPAVLLRIYCDIPRGKELDFLESKKQDNYRLTPLYSPEAFNYEMQYLLRHGISIAHNPHSRPYLWHVVISAVACVLADEASGGESGRGALQAYREKLSIERLETIEGHASELVVGTQFGLFWVKVSHDYSAARRSSAQITFQSARFENRPKS